MQRRSLLTYAVLACLAELLCGVGLLLFPLASLAAPGVGLAPAAGKLDPLTPGLTSALSAGPATATACPSGTPGPWVVRTPQPTAMYGSAAASDGIAVYVAGGTADGTVPSNIVRRYNPATNIWTSLAPMPNHSARANAVYAPNVDRLFVFGGDSLIGGSIYNITRIYNPGTNSWTTGAVMPGGRSGMAAGYYNGKIYLAGGLDGATYKNSTATWAYDPVTDSWDTSLMNMPVGVNTPGFAIINGHLYVAAGLDSDFDPVDTLYDYDIAGNTWDTLPPISIALHAPGSGALGGKLWIFGGGTPAANGWAGANSNVNAKTQPYSPSALNSTYIYDPAANIWSAGPNLNVARSHIAGSVVGNTVVAVGGVDTSMSAIYDTTETNTLASQCPTVTATSTPVVTGTATRTNTAVSSATHTTLPTITGTAGEATETPLPATSIPTNTPTPCAITFTDVPSNHTFYAYIQCLACRGIISGYFDGTFRPNNDITRGQIAKVVSNAAGFNENPGSQVYEDVPPNSTFYAFINRLSMRGVMGGYPCGSVPSEPCGTPSKPYFRPNANSTRGQLAKIVASAKAITGTPTGQRYEDVEPDSTFYVWIEQLSSLGVMGGYPCGTIPGEPCGTPSKPYFRPNNNVTRGQASKIVANTFYPACPMP